MTPRLNCATPSSGFAIPLDRFGVVSQHTLAAFVHDAKVELRVSVPSLGQRMPEPERGRIVAALMRGNSILKLASSGHSSYSHQRDQCLQQFRTMVHRPSKWPIHSIEIAHVEMQACVLSSLEAEPIKTRLELFVSK